MFTAIRSLFAAPKARRPAAAAKLGLTPMEARDCPALMVPVGDDYCGTPRPGPRPYWDAAVTAAVNPAVAQGIIAISQPVQVRGIVIGS